MNIKKLYISPEYEIDIFTINTSIMTASTTDPIEEIPDTPGDGDIDF